MSEYTKVNLQEIEDAAKDNAEFEVHMARKHLHSRDLGISLFRYGPGYRSASAHSHKTQEEAYVVARGSGRALLNGAVVELKEWDVLRVAPETVRAFEAGAEGMDVIAVGGPKPEGGDGTLQTPNWPE